MVGRFDTVHSDGQTSGAIPTTDQSRWTVEPPDQRTPRPSVKQFPLRTNDFAFKRKPVRAREQWQVLALFFTTPKYPRVCFFATQARHSRGFRLHVRLTLRLVEPPPLVCNIECRPARKYKKNTLLHKIYEPAKVPGLCCGIKHPREYLGVVKNGASNCHCSRARTGLRMNAKSFVRNGNCFTEGLSVLWSGGSIQFIPTLNSGKFRMGWRGFW